jgi:hypothetical protein
MMKLSSQIKTISYLKAHAAEIVRNLSEQGEPLVITQIRESATRGYPKELLAIRLREYREIFFKPYRVIYRVIAENVYIMMIVDDRRDMQTFLQRRLLGA